MEIADANIIRRYLLEDLDFIDALLVPYNPVTGAVIHSFDKRVNKLCKGVN